MKRLLKACLLAFLFTACFRTGYGQRGPVATGGVGTGLGGNVSFSVGQVDYHHVTGTNGVLTEGLQQPYEIYLIASVENPVGASAVSVYPNPMEESLILDLGEIGYQHLQYKLCDLHGRQLLIQSVNASKTAISLEGFAQATYILSVMRHEITLQSFKIIKSH